tara:strand:+ start:24 stop:887 length:864 start_codon:yes stop_codon:yes gene_type:complete
MGCYISFLFRPCLQNLSPAWKEHLPELPKDIVRLDLKLLLSQPDLLVKVKQMVSESFAGTTTTAPEGTISWTIDSTASIDNDPSNPLKEEPTKERLACFNWIVEFLFAVELRYGACFLLMEGDDVVSVALLIPPNTKNLHDPNMCILTSAACQAGSPPSPWSSGKNKAKFDALGAIMSKVHNEIMHKQMHWYLQIMATSIKHQGKGYGSKLLNFVVSLSDIYSVPMYLETIGAKCIHFYEKFGFEINEKSKEVFVVVDEKKFPYERLEGGVAMVRQPMDGATDVVVK